MISDLAAEEEKCQRLRDENIRRKHNYEGKLAILIEAAKAKDQT